jgi:hypothetical protein
VRRPVKPLSMHLVSTATPPRAESRRRGGFGSNLEYNPQSTLMLVRALVCLFVAVWLIASCQRRETPQWAPNAERTDITPSEWMVGCFAIDPMTAILRAAGAREQIDLTARPVEVIAGRQWYRVEMNGSHLKYGPWTPIAASKVRLQVGSTGFDNLSYVLSRTNEGLFGTYRMEGDVSPGSGPDIPVTLRRVPCVSAPAR